MAIRFPSFCGCFLACFSLAGCVTAGSWTASADGSWRIHCAENDRVVQPRLLDVSCDLEKLSAGELTLGQPSATLLGAEKQAVILTPREIILLEQAVAEWNRTGEIGAANPAAVYLLGSVFATNGQGDPIVTALAVSLSAAFTVLHSTQSDSTTLTADSHAGTANDGKPEPRYGATHLLAGTIPLGPSKVSRHMLIGLPEGGAPPGHIRVCFEHQGCVSSPLEVDAARARVRN